MPSDQPASSRSEAVRSLERGLALLRAMNRDPHASVGALARRTGVPRSTAYRLLETLAAAGYVSPRQFGGGFGLTRNVRLLSDGFLEDEWLDLAWPQLCALGDAVVWPVALLTQEAATMVIRRSTHERSAMSIDYGMTGRRMPITKMASGRAYLAFCPPAERELILSLPNEFGEPLTRVERAAFEDGLARTREQGFAWRVGGVVAKTASLSAPVMVGQRVLCCVTVIWIAQAMTVERAIETLVGPLRAAVSAIANTAAVTGLAEAADSYGLAVRDTP